MYFAALKYYGRLLFPIQFLKNPGMFCHYFINCGGKINGFYLINEVLLNLITKI
jgi:hypothetical protein